MYGGWYSNSQTHLLFVLIKNVHELGITNGVS